MTTVETKHTPSITFSVPSLSVDLTDGEECDFQNQHHFGGTAGQLSPHPLPRPPPRCLTPYPDASTFPHSLEPSPLSSPAFSAYSMSVTGDVPDEDSDEDVAHTLSKPISSPRSTNSKTDNARLLAPALHMSHLNSPTDIKFREPPLSPIRKLRVGSTDSSPLPSPSPAAQLSDQRKGDKMEKRPATIQLSLKRITTRIPSGPDRKMNACDFAEEESTSGITKAGPDTSERTSSSQGDHKALQELQVHVETVD